MKILNELQIVQLDILKEFSRVAERESLTWFAMFGTLLGAARHGGSIPWDDDVDIALTRGEYDRLRSNTHWFNEPYFLQSPQNDPGASTRFMKLRRSDTAYIPDEFPNTYTRGGHMGICIDIIPLDIVPDTLVAQRIHKLALKINQQMYASAALEESIFGEGYKSKEDSCYAMGGLPGFSNVFAELYEKACSGFSDGHYYAMPVLRGDRGHRVFDREWFNESVGMDYEGLRISAPAGWREVLVASYPEGLYTPDPIYRRIEPKKELSIIDTQRSYKEYTQRYTDMLEGIEGKKVFIFGAGDSLRIWLERYGKGLNVVCAFDNSEEKWGTEAYEIPVCDPAELPGLLCSNSRLIIASIHHKAIGKQLNKMGIEDFFVFIDGWKYRQPDYED